MSTRLGVKRNGEVVEADQRVGPDGKEYYDIQVLMTAQQPSKPTPGHRCKSVYSRKIVLESPRELAEVVLR